MRSSAISYHGAKTKLSSDIVEYFPSHSTYVEVFGGSAAVLMEKDQSNLEVYNDLHDDLVNFFLVLRDSHEELQEFLMDTPYSRSYLRQLQEKWYVNNERPDDEVKRAGEYYYMQFAGIKSIHGKTGISVSSDTNSARAMRRAIEKMDIFAERMRDVVIENHDYSEIYRIYDAPYTLFYLDPPYVEVEDRSYFPSDSDFNHIDFIQRTKDLDGYWVCSYGIMPSEGKNAQAFNELKESDDFYITQLEAMWDTNDHDDREQHKKPTENLIMNFNPDEIERHNDVKTTTEVSW